MRKPDFNGVVIDASRFLDTIPINHRIADAAALDVPWLFNNFAVEAGTRHNLTARVAIPQAGRYHLFVRSRGGSFRVAVDDQVTAQEIAHETLALHRAGTFDLNAGDATVRVVGIEGTPTIDVLVLTPNDTLDEAQLAQQQWPDDVALLRDYTVPVGSAVKFGDVAGDGRMGFMVLARDFSAHVFDHDGRALWSYEAPVEHAERRVHEPPGLLWDLNGDGRAEVVHWRTIDGEERLVVADGCTGEILHQAPWPTQPLPHDYSNFRLAIAQCYSSAPDTILAFTDSGIYKQRQGNITITAYSPTLEQRWQRHEPKLKDHLGHYVYPIDLDGDGRDSIMVGGLMLDADGRERWNRFDLLHRNQEHLDSIRFADLTGNGRLQLVAAFSDNGLVVLDAHTGKLEWVRGAEHGQQLEVGQFLDHQTMPQVALGARTYKPLASQVWWFNAQGDVITKWPANRLNGNPVFVKGNWHGNGTDTLFWYRFRLDGEGKGILSFPEQVYHMFDFTGRGVDEVITFDHGKLRVYGHPHAQTTGQANRDAQYLKTRVANHTHY